MKRAGDKGGAEQGKLGDRERAVGQGESHLEDGDDEEGGGGEDGDNVGGCGGEDGDDVGDVVVMIRLMVWLLKDRVTLERAVEAGGGKLHSWEGSRNWPQGKRNAPTSGRYLSRRL